MINYIQNLFLKIKWLKFNNKKKVYFSNTNLSFHQNIEIRWNIFVNKFCSILAWKKSKIIFEWDCLIWPWTIITSANHSVKKEDKLFSQVWKEKDVIIWDEVWIWGNVTILPWVSIPNGCIIWAWSVVTKSIEKEYSIVWWIPAKLIWVRI